MARTFGERCELRSELEAARGKTCTVHTTTGWSYHGKVTLLPETGTPRHIRIAGRETIRFAVELVEWIEHPEDSEE